MAVLLLQRCVSSYVCAPLMARRVYRLALTSNLMPSSLAAWTASCTASCTACVATQTCLAVLRCIAQPVLPACQYRLPEHLLVLSKSPLKVAPAPLQQEHSAVHTTVRRDAGSPCCIPLECLSACRHNVTHTLSLPCDPRGLEVLPQ